MTTRRNFLKTGIMTGAAAFMMRKAAWAFSNTVPLRKFIQPLPGLGAFGIPLATPNKTKFYGEDFYKLNVGEYRQSFHPDLPDSRLWGYADITDTSTPNHRYLGGVIVANENRPVRLWVKNSLPDRHPLPVDESIMGAMGPKNRITTHLHGGLVPWNSDGGPCTWFTPDGQKGESFKNGNGHVGQAEYYYPNNQSARLMWYHDHAMGTTRLNAYAGIASAYIVRDCLENLLVSKNIIPNREIPLIIQDKSFLTQAHINDGYPVSGATPGDLFYPHKYDAEYGPDFGQVLQPGFETLPAISAVAEFFADTSVVNGAAFPYAKVEQRHYRFRILNGSQARFYNLQLYYAQSNNTNDPLSGEANTKVPGPRMVQIGTEGGLLPVPVALNNPPVPFSAQYDPDGNPIPSTMKFNLLLAPAERADVIIDFSNVPSGAVLVLYSDAPVPFPMGDPLVDYFTGSVDQPGSGGLGFGPNTRTLLQFRVVPRVGPADPPSLNYLQAVALNGPNAFGSATSALLPCVEALDPACAVRTRHLTLNEDFDEYGRLIQKLGTNAVYGPDAFGAPSFGRPYDSPATEIAQYGTTEVWKIFNLTGDVHPMHFHLVNVQVLSRRPFDVPTYMATVDGKGDVAWTGPARKPDANEAGWKETVRMNPGECTTVIMRYDQPRTPFAIPKSPRTGGHDYVWHCHILEHEEHDMMRPLILKP